jgi:hypothetical protein
MAEWIRDYVQQSKNCRQAAAKAASEAERDHLLHMAERWEELARQRAAYMHLEDVLAGVLKEGNGNQNGGANAA